MHDFSIAYHMIMIRAANEAPGAAPRAAGAGTTVDAHIVINGSSLSAHAHCVGYCVYIRRVGRRGRGERGQRVAPETALSVSERWQVLQNQMRETPDACDPRARPGVRHLSSGAWRVARGSRSELNSRSVRSGRCALGRLRSLRTYTQGTQGKVPLLAGCGWTTHPGGGAWPSRRRRPMILSQPDHSLASVEATWHSSGAARESSYD